MSGIYGYLTVPNQDSPKRLEGLSRWNACYGKRNLNMEIPPCVNLGVFLEHFSSNLPEQREMLEKEGTVAVIDCVLFNRVELAQSLNLEASALSDEALLFEWILQKGTDSLKEVNGDFAGVLWDSTSHTLTLFRDHLGIRPLYYYYDEIQFVFSTDIRGILAVPDLKFSLNEMHFYLGAIGRSNQSRTETELEEIHYLKSGTVISFSLNEKIKEMNQKEYWTLKNHHIRLKNNEAYQIRLRQLIEDAVKIRMDAVDGPIGSELSGGLDSTVISMLIHRLGREGKYHSWSADPSLLPILRNDDERRIIEAICKQEGISCKYMNQDNSILIPYQYTFDQAFPPFTNTLPISEVSAWMQKEGGKVVFTGHGGDEGVSRRSHLYELWYHKEYIPCIKALYRSQDGKKFPLLRTIKKTGGMIFKAPGHYQKPFYTDIQIADYLNESFARRMKDQVNSPIFTFAYDPVAFVNGGGLRARMDNTAFQSAAFGVRYMFPYLDYRVIEYAVSVPRHLYHDGIHGRKLYEETFGDLIPKLMADIHSKEMPSELPTEEISRKRLKNLNQSAIDHIAMLDRSFWEPYLDFDKLKKFQVSEDASRQEGTLFNFKLAMLVSYALLQNMMDRTSQALPPDHSHNDPVQAESF